MVALKEDDERPLGAEDARAKYQAKLQAWLDVREQHRHRQATDAELERADIAVCVAEQQYVQALRLLPPPQQRQFFEITPQKINP